MPRKLQWAAGFGLVVGTLMLGQWVFFLLAGRVPELVTEPFRIGFHLAGEALTALALMVGGLGVLRAAPWGRPALLLALGMLIYSVIVSPGYFAQQGQWALVAMFAVLLALAVVCLAVLLPMPAADGET